jgi:hypothetical protein
MVEKRGIEPDSWETLSVEDKVEKLRSFLLSKYPGEDLFTVPAPEEPVTPQISRKRR